MTPSPSTVAVPRYRLFCATWGSFSPESGLPTLNHVSSNAAAINDALTNLDSRVDDATLLHDVDVTFCMDALDRFLTPDGANVIVYLASHGLVPSGANQFFRLATADTRDAQDMTRSLVVAEVIDRIARSRSRQKLVVIDACYSGKAAPSLLSRAGVDLDLPDDICVLASTDPFTSAVAAQGENLSPFTGTFAETLNSGLPGRGPLLSVRSIYSHLRSSAESLGSPQPWMVSTGTAAETITFRNIAGSLTEDDTGAELAERVEAFEHRTEILYVDDQEKLRVDFRTELERAGHHVTVAADPIEGQQALADGHFDIVVIDLLLIGDVPATEFIQLCTEQAPDSILFLISRRTMSSNDNWMRLDTIFAYPSGISAFLWKPECVRTIGQHANRIRDARRHTLSHIEGLDDAVALVTERLIARDESLGSQSERLQLEIRANVEQLVAKWFPNEDREHVYIESMVMRPVDGGRSSSAVFTLIPTLRGIEAESVTPLVLKLGARIDIEQEVHRYDSYVQVGVPLDFRTDKIASALVGGVGGVIYSFRGADDNAIRDVSKLSSKEIEQCLEALFGSGSRKRWHASTGTGDGVSPTKHFERLNYSSERFAGALDALKLSLDKTVHALPPDTPARTEKLEGVFEEIVGSHEATLVHGDLTLDNLVQISDSRFAIIDYRTVGLGPRLVDFVTLELACWLLAKAPQTTRADRFLDARNAIPRKLRRTGAPDGVAEWLLDSAHLAQKCRQLAVENHQNATDEEYGSLLWLAAVRASDFRSRATTKDEVNTQRALLPALALAAQAMIYG